MRKTVLILSTVLLIALLFILGCGIKNIMPGEEMPPLEDYSKVVIVLFNEEDLKNYQNLPTLISYNIGTEMSIKCENKQWCFDQTKNVCPVTEKLKELDIKPCDICQNCMLANKLAEAVNADLVIVGKLNKPKFTEDRSGKVEYDMSKVSVTGADRYYSIYQTAILGADMKVIDPKAGQSIWDGRIIGYKKYKTRYRTGNPPIYKEEATMLADVRKDLVEKLIEKIYPAMTGTEA